MGNIIIMKFVHLALFGFVQVNAVSMGQLEEGYIQPYYGQRLTQVFDDEEEKDDCSAAKSDYDKRVCEAWKAHHDKVAAHKKKFDGIAQKNAAGLMQIQAFDDEENPDCDAMKDEYDKRVCNA